MHHMKLCSPISKQLCGGWSRSKFEGYNEQNNIIQKDLVSKIFIQQVYACKKFERDWTMKNCFVVIEKIEE